MEVKKSEFIQVLPVVLEEIKKADFISFDCEFSGLTTADKFNGKYIDTLEERYTKLLDSAENFPILQYGICCWTLENETYVSRCYEFNLLPNRGNFHPKVFPDQRFSCQTSSLFFLMQNKFDFNKWIQEGISYIRLKEKLENPEIFEQERNGGKEEKAEKKKKISIENESTQQFLTSIMDEVKHAFDQDGLSTGTDDEDEVIDLKFVVKMLQKPIGETNHSQIHQYLVKDKLNSFQHRVFSEQLSANFPHLACAYCDIDNDDNFRKRRIRVISISSLQTSSCEELVANAVVEIKSEKKANLLKEAVGFTTIIECISKEKIPVIGHNCMLDLAKTFHMFFRDLPASFDKFCSEIHQIFPYIFDTRELLISAIESVEDVKKLNFQPYLDQAFEALNKISLPDLKLRIADGFPTFGSSSNAHHAGYDAFMTGSVFFRVLCSLGVKIDEASQFKEVQCDSMKKYVNKLSLGRFSPHHAISLPGPNSNPNRSMFIKVSKLNLNIRNGDLQELFSELFTTENKPKNIWIHWLDDTAAFIEFESKEQSEIVMNKYRLSKEDTQISTDSANKKLDLSIIELSPFDCESLGFKRKLSTDVETTIICEDDERAKKKKRAHS